MPSQPRSDSGSYLLWLRTDEAQTISVGALGEMDVTPGVYAYAGSAFGPGGVKARVGRHVRGEGALHWHVDYLRAVADLATVWFTHDDARRECDWAEVLRELPGAGVPMDGFGASDCTCPAHLIRFAQQPDLPTVRDRIHAAHPDHAPIWKT
jgi:Uri superfamily endonuclease